MTPAQLYVLATEHRYANDPKARRPDTSSGDAGWLVALAARARKPGG